MNKRIAAAFFVLLPAAPLLAQPAPPLIAPLKPGVSWKVEQNDGPGGRFRLVEENAMGEGFRKNIVFPNGGAALTRFVVENLVIYRAPGAPNLSLEPAGLETFGGSIDRRPDAEFSWIKPAWYVREEVMDGVRCFVYRRPTEGESSFETAYVNVDTRFPLRLEKESVIRKYQFSIRTPEPLPGDIGEALKRRKQILAREKQIYQVPQ